LRRSRAERLRSPNRGTVLAADKSDKSMTGLLGCHAVRGIELRRRRSSRVPWIYLVYHVRERTRAVD
jgi:hypothetical protein